MKEDFYELILALVCGAMIFCALYFGAKLGASGWTP